MADSITNETIKQPDPEVTTLNNVLNEYNHHTNTLRSVVNSTQEPASQDESQQLSNNINNDTSGPVDESICSEEIKVTNLSKTTMQTGGDIPVSQFNTSRYILEKALTPSNIILKGMSEIIRNCIQNGMGWGILIIILVHCASARAAPMEVNGSSSIEPSRSAPMEINGSISLDQSSIPEAFSTLSTGAKTGKSG